MKKLTTISLIIFCMITTAVLTAGLVFYQNNNLAPTVDSLRQNNQSGLDNISGSAPSNSSSVGKNTNSSITLNMVEIAKHNTSGDCWMIINNNVYNVTSYLSGMHPGGASTIIPYCGKEATIAFNTRGGTGVHSSYANSLLAAYLVGNLNQAVTTQQIQTNVQNTNSVTPSVTQRRGDDEFDD